MARSAAERLALFESIRDKVEGALASGAPVVSYTVDGQMVQKEATRMSIPATMVVPGHFCSFAMPSTGGC